MIRRSFRGLTVRLSANRLSGAAMIAGTVLCASSALAANPGDTGLAFLKIGVGARAAGMGEAYVAVAQDPTAMYWNPAGIAVAHDFEFHASHNEWISDVRQEYVAAVRGLQGHAFGAQLSLLHMGELEGRDENGVFTESFNSYDFMFGGSYGRRFTRSLEAGATAKILYEKIQSYSTTGFALDLGARYRTPIRGLVVGGTATNMGPAMKYEVDEFLLPFNVRFGAAYRTRALLEGLLLAADLRFPNDSDTKGHLGLELQVHEMIALRGGLKMGYDEESGSAGVGFRYHDYELDYAYSPFSNDSELGDGHRFSIGWRPGAEAAALAAPASDSATPPTP
jgi:hypothetical protein